MTLLKTILPILLFLFIAGCAGIDHSPPLERQLKEITLTGSGYEIGLQHGKQLKKEIGEIVAKWKESASRQRNKDADVILEEFFAYANFTESIKKWTPDLYEEVRGIAVGSGQRFNDILVLNLLDEFWVYIDDLNNHHCSNVGVPSINGNPSYIAQNMDIESYTDGYQVMMRIKRNDENPEQLILTHPGLIALNGMNETGIGTVVNTIMQLSASSSGLPVAFVVRRIINSTDKDELLEFIKNVNHASGQSYIIGIRGDVYNFEASANAVVRHNPENENGTVYHTNHPIVNTDLKAWHSVFMPGQADDAPITRSNSYIRLGAVKKRMVENTVIDPEIIKGALRSKDDNNNPVCRNNHEGAYGFTFASTIMTLTGEVNMAVTAGPPDESEYVSYHFSNNQ